jgi:hypothetical protein
MKRTLIARSLPALALIGAMGASLGLAGAASADHNSCRPGYQWRDTERERGERDGWRAGQEQGYRDAINGRPYSCGCSIDLRCHSYAYQRGFESGFAAGYRAGFEAGRRARSCGGPHGHGHGFSLGDQNFRIDVRF